MPSELLVLYPDKTYSHILVSLNVSDAWDLPLKSLVVISSLLCFFFKKWESPEIGRFSAHVELGFINKELEFCVCWLMCGRGRNEAQMV